MLSGFVSSLLSVGFLVWAGSEVMSDKFKEKHIIAQQKILIDQNKEQEERVSQSISSLLEEQFKSEEQDSEKLDKPVYTYEEDKFEPLTEKQISEMAVKNSAHYMLLNKEMLIVKQNTLKLKPEYMEIFEKEFLTVLDRNYKLNQYSQKMYGVVELFGSKYVLKGELVEGRKSWLFAIKKLPENSEIEKQISKNNLLVTKINLKDKLNMNLVPCVDKKTVFCDKNKMNLGYKTTSNIGLMNPVEIPNVESGFKNRVVFFIKDSFEIVVGIVIATVVIAFLIAIVV